MPAKPCEIYGSGERCGMCGPCEEVSGVAYQPGVFARPAPRQPRVDTGIRPGSRAGRMQAAQLRAQHPAHR